MTKQDSNKRNLTTISRSEWHPMLACGHAANAVCTNKNGIKYDPPIPSCAICSCTEVSLDPPTLHGRTARCCGKHSEKASSLDLAFFEYLGPGCQKSFTMCSCGFYESAHKDEKITDRITTHCNKRNDDKGFTPHGPWAHDSYYCGCRGWD